MTRARALSIARRLQSLVVGEIQRNIVEQHTPEGAPFRPLWANDATFPGGGQSDRAGKPALIDSGAMLASIRPGAIRRVGRKYVCYVVGPDYAKAQHTGFVGSGDRIVGRTLAARTAIRSGAAGSLGFGDWLNLRRDPSVPPRPFIGVSQATLRRIASLALRGR